MGGGGVIGLERPKSSFVVTCGERDENMNNKTSKTANELEAALIKALKAHPECNGVAGVKLSAPGDRQGVDGASPSR